MTVQTTETRPIIPALGPLHGTLSRWSYPMIRFFTGLMLVPHGAQKLFGWFGGRGLEGTGAALYRPALIRTHVPICIARWT